MQFTLSVPQSVDLHLSTAVIFLSIQLTHDNVVAYYMASETCTTGINGFGAV